MTESNVKIVALGPVGSGKSALLGEIEIALRAIGVRVKYADPSAAMAEKNATHAEWTTTLERINPVAWLYELQPGPAKGMDAALTEDEIENAELAAKCTLKAMPDSIVASHTLRLITEVRQRRAGG